MERLRYDEDTAFLLADNAATIARIVRTVPSERLRATRFGEWTAVEVLGHLADSAEIFAERVRRCVTEERPTLQSFDLAWAELNAVLPLVKDPLLAARVAVDLLHLSYYLVRREDSIRFAAMAESPAAGDPLLLAELRLGSSIVRTAANDVRGALV